MRSTTRPSSAWVFSGLTLILASGLQINFTCKTTGAKSYRCSTKRAIPAHVGIGEGFSSSTPCRSNRSRGLLQARLTVNGKAVRVNFNAKTTNGSVTGGCG